MACVNPDGTISPTAKALLEFIDTPKGPEEIAAQLGQPLFKVRSSLRELSTAELVEAEVDKYRITDKGKELL